MDNRKLTQKQIEALTPLEAEAEANRKAREKLRKRLAFEQALGFEENKSIRERIAELDEAYTNLSMKISRIYAAESEMMRHMKIVMSEVEIIKRIADTWGFAVDI